MRDRGIISADHDCVNYTAHWSVRDGVLRVSSPVLGTKEAELGPLARAPENLARMLLRELIAERQPDPQQGESPRPG